MKLFGIVGYLLLALTLFGLFFKIKKFFKDKKASLIIPLAIVVVFFILSFIDFYAFTIFALHLLLIWAIVDLIFAVLKKFKISPKIYLSGILSILFTVIYLGVGFIFAKVVFQTNYDVITSKEINDLRIVQITDSHLGKILNGDEFKKQIEKINDLNPDVFVITGDFVDDESKKEDLDKACHALSNLKTKYGIYYVFGNHDKGYYEKGYRNFDLEYLMSSLEKSGVIILEDSFVEFDDFYIIGRQDKSVKNRLEMDDLTSSINKSKYLILLDHQPNDYINEKNKVDLVLSGHTHGGNVWGANFLVSMANDMLYGIREIENTTFIVSSGISDWEIPYNTCTIQEYVVIDVKN